MPAIYTYQKSQLATISDYVLNVGAVVTTSTINNTGSSGTPITHLDVAGSVYVNTSALGYLSLNLSVFDVYNISEADDSVMQLDIFTVPQQYISNNPLNFMIKDVKALPYYLIVSAKNVGTVPLTVNLRVYGRNFIFVNV